MSNDESQKLQQSGSDWLKNKSDSLDGATRSQLNQARQHALTALDKPRPWWHLSAPLLGTAAAVVLAAVIIIRVAPFITTQAPEILTTDSGDDFELLMEVDDFAIIEELDFYEVLELVEIEAASGQG